MLWVLSLHISALSFWAACLVYMPALIAGTIARDNSIEEPPRPCDSVPRYVFTRIASPAAVLAIIAGTLLLLLDDAIGSWMIVKLTLVLGLVLTHVLAGLLIMRAESAKRQARRMWCWCVAGASCLLLVSIIWLVLAKPSSAVLA